MGDCGWSGCCVPLTKGKKNRNPGTPAYTEQELKVKKNVII